MIKKFIVSLILVASAIFLSFVPASISQNQDIAGTFYGEPIPRENYNFVLKIVLSFNAPWGGIPNNRKQLENRIWDDLILSYAAHRRQISVGKEELEVKISETLKNSTVTFDWKEDKRAYAQWTKETLGKESIAMFENQMRHLVQIKKLRDQVINNVNTSVTEEEAFQEFINENNNLSVELVEFYELSEAQEFYQKVINDPLLWEQERKKDREKERADWSFRRPGFVALEFLIMMWKFPIEAVYEMIEMEIGEIYPPAPIYEGYGWSFLPCLFKRG